MSHSELLNQKFFNVLKLLNFRIYLLNFVMSFFSQKLIILLLLLLYHFFAFYLHMNKLPFALVNLVSLLPFPIIFLLLVPYSSLKKSFFLIDHDSLHSHGSLLHLELAVSHLFSVHFLHCSIPLFDSLNILEFLLMTLKLFLNFSLMPIPSFQKFFCLFICDIGKFFSSIFLEN